MTELSREACTACRPDAPRVTPEESRALLAQLPHWRVIEADGVPRLERAFTFQNFARSLEFTNQVGALAEQENHHPALLTEWGRVTVSWWTHKIRGLHRNDFILAAKTSLIADQKTA